MFQAKGPNKSPETDFNEMEVSDLPAKEFKITVIRILTKVRRKFVNKVIVSAKKKYIKIVPNRNHRAEKYITEINISTEWFNSRIDEAEETTGELKDRAVEFIYIKEQKRKRRMKKSEGNVRDLWDTIKQPNIHILRIP